MSRLRLLVPTIAVLSCFEAGAIGHEVEKRGHPEALERIRATAVRLANEKNYRDAHEIFSTLILLNGSNAEDRVNHAITAIEISKREEGVSLLKAALRDAPPAEAAALYFKVGRYFISRGKLEDALGYLKKAVELSPASARYHGRLAFVLFKLKDFAGAERHYQIGHQLDPTIVTRYYGDSAEKLRKEILAREADPVTK